MPQIRTIKRHLFKVLTFISAIILRIHFGFHYFFFCFSKKGRPVINDHTCNYTKNLSNITITMTMNTDIQYKS